MFLDKDIEKRIKITAWLRSLGRPDKKEYRSAAKSATGEANIFAQRNCKNYFELQNI